MGLDQASVKSVLLSSLLGFSIGIISLLVLVFQRLVPFNMTENILLTFALVSFFGILNQCLSWYIYTK
jgi:hypothetical protein